MIPHLKVFLAASLRVFNSSLFSSRALVAAIHTTVSAAAAVEGTV
jgi:hypothetical protein